MPATCPGGGANPVRILRKTAVAGVARSYIKLHGRGNGDPGMASQCATSAALSRISHDP